jgi:AcrR family transcriptional regulator
VPKIIADQQIYEAALQAVIERGYSGATTKQIAEAADISEVTLFRKYGNKAELIRQAITSMTEQLDFASAARYTGDVAADLLRVVEMYQRSAEKNGLFIYTIMSEMPRYPELAEVISKPMGMFNQIGQLLARYQEEGVLKAEHPMHALAGLLGPLIAINMLRNATDKLLMPPPDLVNHVTFFLNGRFLQ